MFAEEILLNLSSEQISIKKFSVTIVDIRLIRKQKLSDHIPKECIIKAKKQYLKSQEKVNDKDLLRTLLDA